MITMQARPRFITTLLALSATALVAGCGEDPAAEDPLAAIATQYQKALRERPVVREQADATDNTAETLRQIANRAQSAGRESDERAAAILVSGIRSTAATFEYDEAMRAESRAATLRTMLRSMANDADLLAAAADAAASIDLGDTNLLLEGQLAAARQRLNESDTELEELRSQTEIAESQRDESLAQAMELDAQASSDDQRAAESSSIEDWRDYKNGAAYYREQSHMQRIDAARHEISILTIAPTMVLADARREGASETVEAAREARRITDSSLDEVRSYADDVRSLLDELAAGATETLTRIERIENEESIPRLEACVADFEAAAAASRAMTRGGSREDAAAGWRAMANAQFGAGRAHWEIGTIQGRRADLFRRLASSGILVDSTAAGRVADAAIQDRTAALGAAETAFNDAIASLANIQGDAAATLTRSTIEKAIAGVKGETLTRDTNTGAASGSSFPGGAGRSSNTSSGGVGFSSPAEAANFLSDRTNSLSPAAFQRMKSAMRATTPAGKTVEKLLSFAGNSMPLIEALSSQFGEADVMAAFADRGPMAGGGMGGMSLDALQTTFKVDSADGDTATLKSSDGSQSLTLVKTGDGWMVDLDATVEADPNTKMMVQMMGPMIEQLLAPLRTAIEDLTKRVNDGEFESLDDAMAAMEEAMSTVRPQGGASGFPGF